MSKNEEWNRGVGREVEAEQDAGETMDASNSRLYYEATGSSRKGCNIGSMQLTVKDDTLCSHH